MQNKVSESFRLLNANQPIRIDCVDDTSLELIFKKTNLVHLTIIVTYAKKT